MTTKRTRAYRPMAAWLLMAMLISIAGCTERSDQQADGTDRRVLASLSADCRTPLARKLSTISIHADDPLLEANFALANRCGKETAQALRASAPALKSTRIVGPIQGLINFESPHVHPIDLTPDKRTLVAVNTAAHRLEVWRIAGTGLIPLASIPVGLDPVSVRARSDSEVWVVNHVSDSISIVDLVAQTVVRTLHTDNEPADVIFAGPKRAFVTASEANTLNVFELENLDAPARRIEIRGEDPRALAVSPDGQTVYAAVFESGNGTRQTGSAYGVAGPIVRDNLIEDNDVAIIDTNSLAIDYRRRLMNMMMAISVNPASGRIHAVGTEALNEIAGEPALNGRFIKVQVASFAGPGSNNAQLSDLNPHLDYRSPRVPQALRELSAGDPRAIAWRADGTQAFVAAMGSNNIVVIDQQHKRVTQFRVGEGPTGIALDDSAGLGFVMNKFEGTVSIIDLGAMSELSRMSFDDPTPAAIKAGRPFIYNTQLSSGTGHLACASCHVDARTDRLGWQLSDGKDQPVVIDLASNLVPGNLIGTTTVSTDKPVMVTQTLLDIMAHPSFHWRGDKTSIDSFNPTYVNLMGRDGPITATEMDALKAFLKTLWLPPNPYRDIDNSRPATVQLPDGSTAYSRRLANGQSDALRGGGNLNDCLACHAGQGNATRNFGANAEIGSYVVAPALAALYDKIGFTFGRAGFGFFHHGGTSLFEASRNREFLAEILTLEGPGGPLRDAEIRQAPHAGTGQQVTINRTPSPADLSRLDRLMSIATASPWAELIAHARIGGLQRGFVYRSGQRFDADMPGVTVSLDELLAKANHGTPVTFTLVAQGTANRLALDKNLDGVLNHELTDSDRDGTPDHIDAFPDDPQEQVDTDQDGIGNHADLDDDNDGVPDAIDRAPLDAAVGRANPGCNLLASPGFESGSGRWSASAAPTLVSVAHSGTAALAMSPGYLSQLVAAIPGANYQLAGYQRSSGTGWAGYGIDTVDQDGNPIGEMIRTLEPASEYSAFSMQLQVPKQARWLRLWFFRTSDMAVTLDDLSLHLTSCQGQDTDGQVEQSKRTNKPVAQHGLAHNARHAPGGFSPQGQSASRCNRLGNGDFANGMMGWTSSASRLEIVPASPGVAVRFSDGWISARVAAAGGEPLIVSGSYRYDGSDIYARVGLDFLNDEGVEIGEQINRLAQTSQTAGFTLNTSMPAATKSVRLWFHSPPDGSLTLNDIMLRDPHCI